MFGSGVELRLSENKAYFLSTSTSRHNIEVFVFLYKYFYFLFHFSFKNVLLKFFKSLCIQLGGYKIITSRIPTPKITFYYHKTLLTETLLALLCLHFLKCKITIQTTFHESCVKWDNIILHSLHPEMLILRWVKYV